MEASSLEESQITVPHRKISVFMGRIFATVEFDNSGRSLKKVLNLFHLLFLGVSCAIGSGAYSIVGIAAQKVGPGALYTFVIVGLLCFFTCFPYAEFSSKIQSAGFSYSFAYATCGELIGYLTGHALHLMNIASIPIITRCLSAYVASFLTIFGIYLPHWLIEYELLGFKICILGALMVAGFTILMLGGMKESTTINNVVSIINLGTLVFAVFAGTFYIDSTNYENFLPFGTKGIFAGMGLAFYAFLGFEGVTCFTEEAIRPERDVPIALVAVLFTSLVIHSCLALVMTGMAPLNVMATNESLLAVFKHSCPYWMAIIISFGSISGLTAALSATLMLQPRTFYSMAYDRLLPKVFMKTNPVTQVPDFAIIVTGIISFVLTLLFDVELAGNAVSLAGLIVSATVNISVVVARYDIDCQFSKNVNKLCALFIFFSLLLGFSFYYDWPFWTSIIFACPLIFAFVYIQMQVQVNIPKNFKCPCVPLVPMLGTISFIMLACTIDLDAWKIYLIYMGIGVASYFMYGYWQSKLNPYRTESIASVTQAELPVDIENELRERLSVSEHINKNEQEMVVQERKISQSHHNA